MTPDRFREEFPHPAPPPPASVTVKQTSSTPCASSEAAQQPPATTSLTTPPTLFSALRSLYLHISTHPSVRGVVSPTSFINKLKKENELFRGPMHQDAHEFLNFLLNKIVEDLQTEKHARAADVSDKAHGGQDIDPCESWRSFVRPTQQYMYTHRIDCSWLFLLCPSRIQCPTLLDH